MMKAPRAYTMGFIAVLLAIFFLFAFWPRAVPVDLDEIRRERMMLTIEEEAQAQVHDVFTVATPAAGRLLRVTVEPGDTVIAGETVLAEMLPVNPTVLDVRTEEQARAAVDAAEAALELARAEALRAEADLDLSQANRERIARLVAEDAGSRADLDRAERDLMAARASLRSARAAIDMREADLESARAMMMSITNAQRIAATGNPHPAHAYPVIAPASGVVLQVIRESEKTLPAGADILEIGDPCDDLEIRVELLSAEAVRVRPGDRVIIERWGGEHALEGVVDRVEPLAFTKVSALGIEEQRVNVLIRLVGDPSRREGLGHGYRTYVKIVTWEDPDALTVPVSALFRDGEGWALFTVEGGRARKRSVEIGRRNASQAQLLTALAEGTAVVLYPSDSLADGMKVRPRG